MAQVAPAAGAAPVKESVKIPAGWQSGTPTQKAVWKAVKDFDDNADGRVDVDELADIIDEMLDQKRDAKRFRRLFFVASGVVLLLLAVNAALTFAMVELAKEQKVSGDVLESKSSGNPLQVASSETQVVNGRMVMRGKDDNSSQAITMSQNLESTSLNSQLPMKALKELRYFDIVVSGKAELRFFVHAIGRVPETNSVHGTVVHIITLVGTITLDDDMLSFEEEMAPLFKKAGLVVDSKNRRLLGTYDLVGFFNLLEKVDIPGIAANEKPRLYNVFTMSISVLSACDGGELNGNGQSICKSMYPRYSDDALGGGETNWVNEGDYLPGTQLLADGRMWMGHQEFSERDSNGMIRIRYDYDSQPNITQWTIFDATSQMEYSWQEFRGKKFYCKVSKKNLPYSQVNASEVDIKFMGLVEVAQGTARHFRSQVEQEGGVTFVDMYDNATTRLPIAFTTTGGDRDLNIVIESITDTASTIAIPSEFADPSSPKCYDDLSPDAPELSLKMPLVSGAFDRPYLLDDELYTTYMDLFGSSDNAVTPIDTDLTNATAQPWAMQNDTNITSGGRRLQGCGWSLQPPGAPCALDVAWSEGTCSGLFNAIGVSCAGTFPPLPMLSLKGYILVTGLTDNNGCCLDIAGCAQLELGFEGMLRQFVGKSKWLDKVADYLPSLEIGSFCVGKQKVAVAWGRRTKCAHNSSKCGTYKKCSRCCFWSCWSCKCKTKAKRCCYSESYPTKWRHSIYLKGDLYLPNLWVIKVIWGFKLDIDTSGKTAGDLFLANLGLTVKAGVDLGWFGSYYETVYAGDLVSSIWGKRLRILDV